MKHKEERNRLITVDNGKITFRKHEKFCVSHGWIDVFAVGGEMGWQRLHGDCGRKPRCGAAVEVKTMAKAA